MNNENKHQNFVDQLKEKIASNITDIEARDDLSANEKSSQIIHIFSAACAGHRWRNKRKSSPVIPSLRELILSCQINWKNFKLPTEIL